MLNLQTDLKIGWEMSSNKKAIKGHKITLKNTSAKASSLTAKI